MLSVINKPFVLSVIMLNVVAPSFMMFIVQVSFTTTTYEHNMFIVQATDSIKSAIKMRLHFQSIIAKNAIKFFYSSYRRFRRVRTTPGVNVIKLFFLHH